MQKLNVTPPTGAIFPVHNVSVTAGIDSFRVQELEIYQ
jgi:hypothetical protein